MQKLWQRVRRRKNPSPQKPVTLRTFRFAGVRFEDCQLCLLGSLLHITSTQVNCFTAGQMLFSNNVKPTEDDDKHFQTIQSDFGKWDSQKREKAYKREVFFAF
jgi:hypothetical protein